MDFVYGLVMIGIAVAVYFIPLLIASKREHPSGNAIAALNLLAGWTFLGWLIALVWSLSAFTPVKEPSKLQKERSANDLFRLAELREKGLLTQEEFEREKAKLI